MTSDTYETETLSARAVSDATWFDLDSFAPPILPPDEQALECPFCDHEVLEFLQPDTDLPDRLIGACGSCKTWFLADGAKTLLLNLEDGSRPPWRTSRRA